MWYLNLCCARLGTGTWSCTSSCVPFLRRAQSALRVFAGWRVGCHRPRRRRAPVARTRSLLHTQVSRAVRTTQKGHAKSSCTPGVSGGGNARPIDLNCPHCAAHAAAFVEAVSAPVCVSGCVSRDSTGEPAVGDAGESGSVTAVAGGVASCACTGCPVSASGGIVGSMPRASSASSWFGESFVACVCANRNAVRLHQNGSVVAAVHASTTTCPIESLFSPMSKTMRRTFFSFLHNARRKSSAHLLPDFATRSA